jgi:hypothetical protein
MIKTFTRKMSIGDEVDVGMYRGMTKQQAVHEVATRHGLSESYVYRTLKPSRELRAKILENVSKTRSFDRRTKPNRLSEAQRFLIFRLLNGPRLRAEIIVEARNAGISIRTLGRAYRQWHPAEQGSRSKLWKLPELIKKAFTREEI